MYRECPNCLDLEDEEFDLGVPTIPECIVGEQVCVICSKPYYIENIERLSLLEDTDAWKEFLK